jgi:hypothetical protein
MRNGLLALSVGASVMICVAGLAVSSGDSKTQVRSPFAVKLDEPIERFDAAGRSLTDAVLDLAFKHQLPLGIEYVDREAALRPLTVDVRGRTTRETLVFLAAAVPGYQVEFSHGVASLFSPRVREDRANLLNKVIPNFEVAEADPFMANIELICALHRQLLPPAGCGGSFPIGSPKRISIHMRGARVSEILDAIVAKQGAVWFVKVRPETLAKDQVDFGHVYELVVPFDRIAKDRIRGLFQVKK